MAGTIGGRRHNRFPECREDVPRHFVRGHAYGDRIEPGHRQLGHRTTGSLGQDERQRPRPKVFRQPRRVGVKAREALRVRDVGDMGDERIEGRPALGVVKARDGGPADRVGAEAVNGLGRKGHEAAGRQHARGIGGRRRIGFRHACRRQGCH